MKKVLLVDDEILIRETIRDCIHWEREGFQYLGDASDGEVALPMIEQMQPDILITDIKMPFMNGLELSKIVRSRMPDVKIIILSGHGEFEYARKALSMGVVEYCLKPISSSDLMRLLRRVSDKIDKERSEKEQLAGLMQREHEKTELSRQKLLNDLCGGLLSTTEAIQTAEALSLRLVARWYAVVLMDLRLSPENSHDLDAPLSALKRHVEDGREQILEYRSSLTKTVWIVKGDNKETLEVFLRPFREMQNKLETESHCCEISLGIGSAQERLQGIHLSFLEAEEGLHWQRLSRQNRKNLLEATRSSIHHSIFLDRQAFIRFLKIGTPRQLESFIPEFASALAPIDWNASLTGYYLLNDLTLEVFKTAEEWYRGSEADGQRLVDFQQSIESIRNWGEACHYLTRLVEQFWHWRSHSSDRYAHLLLRVKEYITSNYDKDHISLQDAAESINMSPSHLSKIFSQETGQTFIEFLTQTRINKAMELLQSTQAKTYEIAFQVGYSDPHYFSNLFKRVTGMTTTEFRKQGASSTAAVSFGLAEGEQDERASFFA
ncbi:response regulator [Paenibacillus sp. Marseille-P2973]|uniref:response regulator n=1 Tax=Paenibacillus sp. Marseille-P2973 TaxID=1871032 RepID=UPI001B3845DF|nr:response regulator [Paenibacillus sp. Marseille-P2973]MBQ4899109.1 response regulator [Paenibacillus sp. Marseille-P2973]